MSLKEEVMKITIPTSITSPNLAEALEVKDVLTEITPVVVFILK